MHMHNIQFCIYIYIYTKLNVVYIYIYNIECYIYKIECFIYIYIHNIECYARYSCEMTSDVCDLDEWFYIMKDWKRLRKEIGEVNSTETYVTSDDFPAEVLTYVTLHIYKHICM
jgi:hypothetical protein